MSGGRIFTHFVPIGRINCSAQRFLSRFRRANNANSPSPYLNETLGNNPIFDPVFPSPVTKDVETICETRKKLRLLSLNAGYFVVKESRKLGKNLHTHGGDAVKHLRSLIRYRCVNSSNSTVFIFPVSVSLELISLNKQTIVARLSLKPSRSELEPAISLCRNRNNHTRGLDKALDEQRAAFVAGSFDPAYRFHVRKRQLLMPFTWRRNRRRNFVPITESLIRLCPRPGKTLRNN
ncbi:hypothetical protein TcasGA2_TC012764 [Tribolium castaneum]|uniref:Uncharacterized protein n=1 Tax=Tribolium castaneum TaxID=7070 RepID=D6X099_TRICA|nr:hypothetical protein TcasGA2_TC012764 [Tribolium castaneum]